MAGYFNDVTEAELVAEHYEQDATKQALEGLPRMAENFDSSIARMRDALKTLHDANPVLVPAGHRKKMGAGMVEVFAYILSYVDARRTDGTIPSEGIAARMRRGS